MARDTTKLQYWGKHIKKRQASGLAQRAYCAREGIKWPTFDYWRRQILSDITLPQPAQKPADGLTLVPVRVAGSEVMSRIAAPMVGGMLSAPMLSLFVVPAAYRLMRRRRKQHCG